MNLKPFVNFYRFIGKPEIKQGRMDGEFCLEANIIPDLKALLSEGYKYIGEFRELESDTGELTENTDFSVLVGQTIEYCFAIDQGGEADIYPSYSGFLTTKRTLCLGEFPEELYIVEGDIYYKDGEDKTSELQAIWSQCELIKCLSKHAHYHDSKTGSQHRLVYIQNTDSGNSKTLVINPAFSDDSLNVIIDIDSLNFFQSENENPNISREIGVFRTSLIEFLSDNSVGELSYFSYLVKNWCSFLELYQNNFDTYLSGFAFHQAKKEVAEAELSFAHEMSKVLSDITGKILGIPLSLVAIVALAKSSLILEQILLLVGVMIASAVIASLVGNQSRQVKRIKHAQDTFFSGLNAKKSTYPADLLTALEDAQKQLKINRRVLSTTLFTYRVVCWAPTFIATGLFLYLNLKFFKISYFSILNFVSNYL